MAKKETSVYTIEQFIDIQLDDMESIVMSQPFLAFPLLAILIEAFGKYISHSTLNIYKGNGKNFYNAINSLESLKLYRKYNCFAKNGKALQKNDLYSWLRCSIVHDFLPSSKIQLAPKNNNLGKDIIGCEQLFIDIKAAWKEIKTGNVKSQINLKDPHVSVQDEITGGTTTNATLFL